MGTETVSRLSALFDRLVHAEFVSSIAWAIILAATCVVASIVAVRAYRHGTRKEWCDAALILLALGGLVSVATFYSAISCVNDAIFPERAFVRSLFHK